MADARGRVRFRTPHAGDAAAAATARVGAGDDALTVRAALPPAFAARIVAHHWHLGEDLAYDVGIPLAMLGCVAAAVVLVRRERQLVRARQEFVASVSHELRTPLAQVRAIAETLRLGRARTDAERDRWLGVIDREARRLGDLVESIVLYSHLERAGFRVRLEDVDLSALVLDAVRAHEPFAASRRARLVAEVAPGVGARADAHAVRQVLVNLLDNALKYGPAGQTVTVGLVAPAGARARLSVCDEGPGVPPADRGRVWRPFTRLASAASAPGTGLGLAVVRALAEQHGGAAWVEDAPGGGACFVVEVERGG